MYYIAYTIIGIGLGGIVFLLIKKLPQFFSKGETELNSLLKKGRAEKSRFKSFDFGWLKGWSDKISAQNYKNKLFGFVKKTSKSLSAWFGTAKDKLKEWFSGSISWAFALKDKVNLNFKGSKQEKEEPLKLDKKESQEPEPRAEFEEQEEFFTELLGQREEAAPEDVETETVMEEEPFEDERTGSQEIADDAEVEMEEKKQEEKKEEKQLSKEEKEIQQWIEKLKEEPKNKEAYMELGFIYFERGQKQKAKSCLESAKKLGIENERVDNLLSRLED